MPLYQNVYPTTPAIQSKDLVRPSASDLLKLEYFEAQPGTIPINAYDQHHIVCNLVEKPHRVENWRDGEHHDFVFKRNDVLITPAGIQSGWRWHGVTVVIVITIEPTKLGYFTERELGRLLYPKQLKDVLVTNNPDLTDAAIMLRDSLYAGGLRSVVMYESLARVFLVKLLEGYGLERSAEFIFNQSFTAQHYKKILDLVAERYSESISVEDLAYELDLSTSHFSRLFKSVIGETPYQFLMNYRIECSQTMLADKNQSIGDIAIACGFADHAHFSRVFKRIIGESPTNYRSRL
jgi:AraC family transcriptional regulator